MKCEGEREGEEIVCFLIQSEANIIFVVCKTEMLNKMVRLVLGYRRRKAQAHDFVLQSISSKFLKTAIFSFRLYITNHE